MKANVHWSHPIPLRSGLRGEYPIYRVPDLDDLPQTSGVYCFGRLNRERLIPLYVGKASNLKRRIRTQLNNARLMLGIKNSPGRRRVLVLGEIDGKPGQHVDAAMSLIEKTLIEYAGLEGYELINQMGTRPATHTISFSGSRIARSWLLPRFTVVRRRRGRS